MLTPRVRVLASSVRSVLPFWGQVPLCCISTPCDVFRVQSAAEKQGGQIVAGCFGEGSQGGFAVER